MALDKVIDSAVLDAGLTSVADAIRAKGGTSEQLAFPDGFVSAVEGIQAGGGDNQLSPYLKVTDNFVTVGANTITGAASAKNYLCSCGYKNALLVLQEDATVDSQIVVCGVIGATEHGFYYRIRNGALNEITGKNDTYDAFLVEGTTYRVLQLEV